MTRYEKAAAVAIDIAPDAFHAFYRDGRNLIGVAIEERVTFSPEEVATMALAYDKTIGRYRCPYGSNDVDTLVSHYLDHGQPWGYKKK